MNLFAIRLRQERERAGLSTFELARRCCVHRVDVEQWEADAAVPTRLEFKRLIGSLRRLRFFPPDRAPRATEPHEPPPSDLLAIAAAADASPSDPEPVEPLPLPEGATLDPPATFGEALRRERELEDVDQDTVGALIGVTGQAVSAWEGGISNPVRANFEKLLVLFPRLAHAPQPTIHRDEAPDGGRGIPRSDPLWSAAMSLLPDPAPAAEPAQPEPEEPAPASPATLAFDQGVERALGAVRLLTQPNVDAGAVSLYVKASFDPRSTRYEVGLEGNRWMGSGRTPSAALKQALGKARSPLLARRDELRRQLAEAEALVEALEP
jgi:transcriptional regulator with XRE-family HTH domain